MQHYYYGSRIVHEVVYGETAVLNENREGISVLQWPHHHCPEKYRLPAMKEFPSLKLNADVLSGRRLANVRR